MSSKILSANRCQLTVTKPEFALDVDFNIPDKGVLGIFGHSGSGKTTLLRCLAGLEKKVRGEITFKQQNWLKKSKSVSPQQRNIGYIFQDSRLFPHLSVIGNLHYAIKRAEGAAEENADVTLISILKLLNIEHLKDRMPASLSGGEKQRVAIARALVKKPQMLLMDEPMASLDDAHKHEILPYLEQLHDRLSIPIIYVSHSLEEVSKLCDYVVALQSGKIIFEGTIEEALTSVSSPLLKTESATAVLNAKVDRIDTEFNLSTVMTEHGTHLVVKGLHKPGTSVRLGINAADVSICLSRPVDSSILNILPATVLSVIQETASEVLLQLNVNQDIFLARISKRSYQQLKLAFDMDVYIQIKGLLLTKDRY